MKNDLVDVKIIVEQLKTSILSTQVRAAKKANRELLQLYFYVGAILSVESKKADWGTGVLATITTNLQQELPGLRGFSVSNLKKMRIFYEAYPFISIGSPLANQLKKTDIEKGSPVVNEIQQNFWEVGFSHHYLILSKTTTTEERAFYLAKTKEEGWSKRVLENHLNNRLFEKKGSLPNNFRKTLTNHEQILNQFRDEYLLDFISLNEADNERLIEGKIVQNITKFILNLGKGFSFVGNQYRVAIDDKEFFIDLLFYNRILQALVAIELKRGEFKPQYAGQLNFYLNVLDDTERMNNENPSIGIILCKEKNNVVVEYALRGLDKPMGVATFKTMEEIPEAYKEVLPPVNELIKLLKDV